MSILFDNIIFGPIKSRRLGLSLGINLLPKDGKVCSFDCIYCECGLNNIGKGSGIPTLQQVTKAMEVRFAELHSEGLNPDVITFAGNGEPTLHPEFPAIIDLAIQLKNRYFPKAKISVLSNATTLSRPDVVDALKLIDNPILKLDSVTSEIVRLIDRPNQPSFQIENVINQLKTFDGKLIIQTLFLKGIVEGTYIDNSTPIEVENWLEAIKKINPQSVMIYTIDRETPYSDLRKISLDRLHEIAERVDLLGIKTQVAG